MHQRDKILLASTFGHVFVANGQSKIPNFSKNIDLREVIIIGSPEEAFTVFPTVP